MLIIVVFWVISLKYSLQKSSQESSKPLIPDEIGNSVQKMQEEWQTKKGEVKSNLPSVFEDKKQGENPFSGQNKE